MKLQKELLLLHQLRHPNLVPLLGYCARSEQTVSVQLCPLVFARSVPLSHFRFLSHFRLVQESTSLQDHGVVGVYEYALPFYPSTLAAWPAHLRLKTALELADLLVSPS